jgi:AMP nucleosidase
VGNFIIPSAAIRGEGTSRHYLPPDFPAIPASSVNLYCIGAVRTLGFDPRCGIVYTTDRRLWEFDEEFEGYLRRQRILAIEMELATLFSVAYRYEVPIGSIMLVSDMPLQRRGIKDKKLHEEIYAKYMETHLDIAMDAVKSLSAKWEDVHRKLASEW